MKNFIDDVVNSFTRDEYREFKYFLLRRPGTSESRKDLLMLESIRNKKQLSEKNVNASYQIKKGLKKQLEQFAMLENLRHDKTSEIRMQIDIAKYLFHKNLYAKAVVYLTEAEKLAKKTGAYKLLDQILDMQISYSYKVAIPAPNGTFVPDLLNKMLINQTLSVKESNANAAYCELIYEIRKTLSQNLSIDIELLKTNIFRKYHLDENHDINNLSSYCNYINIISIMLREEKNYKALKECSINCYNFLSSKNLLDTVSDDFVFNLLADLCASSIRTKDYADFEKFILLRFAHTKKMRVVHERSYYDFIEYMAFSDLYLVTNRLPEAKEKLLTAKNQYAAFTQPIRIFYLLRMNLMGMHFISDEYGACIKLYQEIILCDENKLLSELYFRLEHLLMTDIYGVLFYYEDGDIYYALHLLAQLKRRYAAVLASEASAREYIFIKILQKILKNPSYIKSEKFLSDTEEFVLLKPYIPGDLEYISLNAWLTAKSTHRKYYDCFLEEVKP